MKPSANTVFIILTALIVAAGAYWYFFAGASTEPSVMTTSVVLNPAQAQFQTLVAELQPITFSPGIFEDARFMALRDLTTPISPENMGRPDPFAPVAGLRAQ